MSNAPTYILTHTGKKFDLVNPKSEDVDIEDIAHSLSQINRFGGHSAFPYSVAQHSVLCSLKVGTGFELEALLHDATEAYLGDMMRPLKNLIPAFSLMENILWRSCIAPRFGLPEQISKRVKDIDDRMMLIEAAQLQHWNPKGNWWEEHPGYDPLFSDAISISHWDDREAKANFLNRYKKLTRGEKK